MLQRLLPISLVTKWYNVYKASTESVHSSATAKDYYSLHKSFPFMELVKPHIHLQNILIKQ